MTIDSRFNSFATILVYSAVEVGTAAAAAAVYVPRVDSIIVEIGSSTFDVDAFLSVYVAGNTVPPSTLQILSRIQFWTLLTVFMIAFDSCRLYWAHSMGP